jgi:nucleoside phosphorylase
MSNPEVYTVGWICAIDTEYIAAQVLLDEEHEPLEYVGAHDSNDYTLGKMGTHHVVIAVLPEGDYGIVSAATVAQNMLHTFPNVRIGLLVGVGGGAPSARHDIRLGDVVVSTPSNGRGGVFQYDFGRQTQGEAFEHTRFLNQPPAVLRTAISGIKARHKVKGHQIQETISELLARNPKLRKDYSAPDKSKDRLYMAGTVHPASDQGQSDCAVTCGDDALVYRPDRTPAEDNPAIHYGLIASGSQLIKNAVIRDRLASEMGILCFEMEAAGLMNGFPCLVIRGICDYADSHKNDAWQGYAALTAAVYAKDLLSRILPAKIEAEKGIKEILLSG